MPKRGAFALGLTAAALVLLLNFQTPSDVASLEPATRSGTPRRARDVVGPAHDRIDFGHELGLRIEQRIGAGSQATAAPAVGSGAVSGSAVDTRYGPVQVSVTIENGKLTAVTALQLPSGGRSGRISNEVEPMLQQPGAVGAEREHRRRLGRDVHQLGVRPDRCRPRSTPPASMAEPVPG